MRRIAFVACTLTLLAPPGRPLAQQSSSAPVLQPTNHPKLPSGLSDFWMVPDRPSASAPGELAIAIKLLGEDKPDAAFNILSRAGLESGPLEDYIEYYRGIAELKLDRQEDALRTFQRLEADEPVGFLAEGGARRQAETFEAMNNAAGAAAVYERLSTVKTTAPDEVLMKLGVTSKAAGNSERAIAALSRLYYEYPTSEQASTAGAELETTPGRPPLTYGSDRYKQEMARAERLFAARNITQARPAFQELKAIAQGDDRDLIALRLAESDYHQRRWRLARDGVKPFTENGPRRSEALFYYAGSLRNLKAFDAYVTTVDRLADEFPADAWAEEALNDLASHHIIQDDDLAADVVLRDLYERFPKGRFAERAAWKIGWLAFRNGRFTDTVKYFEAAAANFPRSDYRPGWLYWAGRAHDELKEPNLAQGRYAVLAADYSNTYYGRLGAPRLTASQRVALPDIRAQFVPPTAPGPPPNRDVIRALLGLELYDQAFDELRYAQMAWGDSPTIQATLGYVYNRRGEVRAGINAIKRAYPQYMTAGGEKLPTELLKLLYPVDFWPEIQRYSAQRGLDPYLIAALVLQESNFDPAVRSSANAYGLMQLLPSTGRRYARTLKITNRFTISLLKKADPNLNMGTAYFADLMKMFDGGAHFALASYNAGEGRVKRWQALSPGSSREEFIEDIPFFETSNYVKRILGTMEDYRRLYGSKPAQPAQD